MENEEARKGARVGSARSADVLVVVGLDIPSDYGIRAKDPSEDYLCRSWHYTRVWAWVTEYMQVSMLVNTMLGSNNRYLHIFNHPRLYPSRYHIPVTMRLVLCSTCVVIQ